MLTATTQKNYENTRQEENDFGYESAKFDLRK